MNAAEDIHVVPIGDLREHVERPDCWCHPTRLVSPIGHDVIVHNSADGRELVEQHGVN